MSIFEEVAGKLGGQGPTPQLGAGLMEPARAELDLILPEGWHGGARIAIEA